VTLAAQHALTGTTPLNQVVEAELMRVPAHIARRYSRQLWSVVYIPQVSLTVNVLLRACIATPDTCSHHLAMHQAPHVTLHVTHPRLAL
jgi:hypothetical protein